MNDEINKLAKLAQAGQTNESQDRFYNLVDAIVGQSNVNPKVFADCAASQDEVVRKAVISAVIGRNEPSVEQIIAQLAADRSIGVRQHLVYALTDNPQWPMTDAAGALLDDPNSGIRQSAVWCVRDRPSLAPRLADRLRSEKTDWVRTDIANALAECDPRISLPVLAETLARDGSSDVQQSCVNSIERHLGTLKGFPSNLTPPTDADLLEIRRRVSGFTFASFPNITKWLDEQLTRHVDLDQLANYGTVLTREAESGELARAFHVDHHVASLMAVLMGGAPKAAVVVGDSGVGKTAVIHELVYHLREIEGGPWYVVRISPTEFLTDTKYLGEWETRLRKIVEAFRAPKRVVLYVPNIDELTGIGVWQKSDASVASALAPYIERGDIVILGESTVEGFRKGLGANQSLRRLFHAVELKPTDDDQTRRILEKVVHDSQADVAEIVMERLGELASFFVAGAVQPGRTVGLLRRVLGMTAGNTGPITEKDVLKTISVSTGIPVDFLDDTVPLDRNEVRSFFESRVMGQPEAVDAVVDLVTLVKAGLTDPLKPFGVLLFVGPTGVGKTELARTLAEHLFGDAGRMIRLDMSEFATYEAYERLIGSSLPGASPGILTTAVRERPFSVLLLDEIEKAHPNIYNLCLQIFDAGRLTDAQGRTADFRRTIIILTSNVGSKGEADGFVGFGRKSDDATNSDMTMRELGRWFRPEFLNRLDRIVVFRALAMETAEKIARREVAHVLERSGISRRRLIVDVDPDVFPLLLREGYSAAFGARPLKRTVERQVLLPVARMIAAGKAPLGSLLRLTAHRDRVEIHAAPPEPADKEEVHVAPKADAVLPRALQLKETMAKLRGKSSPLASRKSELLTQSSDPEFWDDADASQKVLDEIYRLDGILAGLGDLEKKVSGELERAERNRASSRTLAAIDKRLDVLEKEAEHVAFLFECRDRQALGDALVTVQLVSNTGEKLDGVLLLSRMYQKFAERRQFDVEIWNDFQGGDPPQDAITLAITGPGAYALLVGEAGLHQFTKNADHHPTDEKGAGREVVRIDVLPAPVGKTEFPQGALSEEVRSLKGQRGRLLSRLNFELHLLHHPSLTSIRIRTGGAKKEAIGRARSILKARCEAGVQETADAGKAEIVRRYRLGPTTLVRDQRSGRRTGRLDKVLAGQLDLFLGPHGARGT